MTDYTPLDSLAYLNSSVGDDLDELADKLNDIDNVNDLAEAQSLALEAVNQVYELAETIRSEAAHHNITGATHYSNGTPITVHYKRRRLVIPTDDGPRTLYPDCYTTVHPSGRPDAQIPITRNV